MANLYIYVLDTLADWEIGNLTAEVNSKRFFKKDAKSYEIKFVGSSMETITTMGGIHIQPDCVIDSIQPGRGDIIVLPGADTWSELKNITAVQKATEFLEAGETACAICGATVALASAGILDARQHTSNGAGFLNMFVKNYSGDRFYCDLPACVDEPHDTAKGTLITAGSTGGLMFAKYILEKMGVMRKETVEAWYGYFSTGNADQFFAMMQSLK